MCIRDRSMVLQAEEDGLLKPGSTLIEPSSGNTGIALAMIASMRNYKLKIVLPENVSIERKQLLEVWGAEIISSPGELGSNGAVRLAQEISEENPDWVFLYQYGNESNPQVHYETTGPEILADVPGITHFVAGLGTSGTLMGVGKFLREHKEDVEILAVEPPSGEVVQGLRSLEDGFIPPVFENWKGLEILNGKRIVRPKESIHHTRLLASECGIFSGISSGAALAGAMRVSEKIESGVIVFIVCDGGWKYLSTGAWSGDLEDVAKSIDSIIYF